MPDFPVIFNEGLEHIKKCVFIQFQSSSCTCSFSEHLTGLTQTGNLVKYQFEMVS